MKKKKIIAQFLIILKKFLNFKMDSIKKYLNLVYNKYFKKF